MLIGSATIVCIDLWPSRQSRNRYIRAKISGYNLDCGRVKLGADLAPTRSRWVSNNCITRCHRQVQLVGDKMLKRKPAPSRGLWALRNPDWAAQQNEKYVAVCPVSNSPLTHNPFATISNKVWEVYFFRKCVRSSLLLILFPHVYMYCDYATLFHLFISYVYLFGTGIQTFL